MKRRIIKQGHNTMTITLPIKWVNQHNLKPGTEIDLLERDEGLLLLTQPSFGDTKKIEINIIGKDIPTIWKYFMAVYREGYDEIIVKFDPKERLEYPHKFYVKRRLDIKKKQPVVTRPISEVIQYFVDRFIGLEIIEHGKDYIVMKEMGEVTNKEFNNSLRRIFLLVQQMAEEVVEAINSNNIEILNHTQDVDINLDKFHDYCIRILNKIGNGKTKKIPLYFSTLYLLEMLGDEFKNISLHLVNDLPKARLRNLRELAESVKEEFEEYYNLFYKFDAEKVNKLSQIDREIYMRVPEIHKKVGEEEKEIFHHLRMIGRYINALMELRIEMEF